jgi:hypothetical protein
VVAPREAPTAVALVIFIEVVVIHSTFVHPSSSAATSTPATAHPFPSASGTPGHGPNLTLALGCP